MRLAMKNATSSGKSTCVIAALLMRMATQVSSSGGSIATVKPQPKRDFKRSSSPSTSFGIPIAGQDHLLLAFQQCVEGVKNSS
jgi:hypothetical protein